MGYETIGPADILAQVALLGFAISVVLAGLSDLRTFHIPNAMVLSAGVFWVLFAFSHGLGLETSLYAVATGLAVLALGIAAWSFGGLGGGDAKLLAVCALWAGPAEIAPFLIHTLLAGGVLGLIALKSDPLRYLAARTGATIDLGPARQIPYGVAIATGAGLLAWRLLAG